MEIKMPQLGESVTEGTIGSWLVQPGESVAKYQPVAEVITDKVNAEIPAPTGGVIMSLEVADGATVKVGTVIALMQAEGEGAVVAPTGAGTGSADLRTGTGAGARVSGPAAVALPAAEASPVAAVRPGGAPRYSPAVMRLAQEHGIDPSLITGTGLGGRVTRKDVEAVIASAETSRPAPAIDLPAAQPPALPPAQPSAPPPAPQSLPGTPVTQPQPPQLHEGDQLVPVGAVRRRIAEKMLQSKHEAPHAWSMVQVDATGLVRLKEQVGEEFKQREGVGLSFVPFFIKAVVEALKEFPLINSQWAGDSIIVRKDINISVAVATETALAVPVIKNADRLSIAGLNQAVADLTARARAGRLTLEDISGGTFTVNNTGSFGSFASAPIINYPQAAILSFEAITRTPVVLENDAIAIRSMMNICLSLDHRILDGLICGRFLQAVKGRLQSYGPGSVSLY